MGDEQDKFIWTTKLSGKGQIVLPKQAREVFGFNEGDTLILLGDKQRGIAIAKYDDYLKFAEEIFKAKNGDNND
ncbi:MAG: AbrB/MazE/SpoVT family DNA-binding domain-containing protein [Clostridiales bacterium]|nr:AbrB/MazE/SpoVT family DNA-binding domain-containing protein [Clostridiales bacterium]MCH5163194.1 AbrB/MazE/SpoVT family DNA-binding domain-containing protein [Clostridiales bacterium]